MVDKVILKQAWYNIKNLDDFDTFNNKELAKTRLYNAIAILFYGSFTIYNLLYLRYLWLILALFYLYRMFKLELYIHKKFK